jgi:putative PEP-CTERM system histidine kinase
VIGLASFALAAFTFSVLAGLILPRGTSTRTGQLFVVAVLVQVFWALCFASVYTIYSMPNIVISIAEAARSFVWTLFLISFGLSSKASSPNKGVEAGEIRPFAVTKEVFVRRQWIAMGAAAIFTATVFFDWAASRALPVGAANFGSKVIAAVLGLWCIEQLYRNTPQNLRWAIKFLCIAMAALFGYDMVLYTEALLFERVNYAWMSARGLANAILVPLLAISAARNKGWKVDIMVSRQMVLHSTTLLAAGIFLISMSTIGYYVRYFGGQWGEVGQALVLFVGALVLIVLLFSGQLRAQIRVFVAKHFYSYRYDYREEWLALTRSFADHKNLELAGKAQLSSPLPSKAILALGHLVESQEGSIWLATNQNSFRLAASVPSGPIQNVAHLGTTSSINAMEPFLEFIKNKEWVVVLPEVAKRRDLYGNLAIPPFISRDPLNWLVIPLLNGDEMVGFVSLKKPKTPMEINWEIRDVLKTAARQTASYLAVESAVEQLVVARQFESFNKMSAFVVHDLKNLVAQLQLLLTNAARHRNNPEFQDDMLTTVENVMDRMRGLLLQLRAGTNPIEQTQIVAIKSVIEDALESKKSIGLKPNVVFHNDAANAQVKAHPDRLARVLGHLIQNASEACNSLGKITISINIELTGVVIRVTDNGSGMDEKFLSTKLFKPFESTKVNGMGIGMFESKEYISQLSGSLEVQSAMGQGSTFTISLPIVEYN